MAKVSTSPLPQDSLLHRYENGTGNHTDCYTTFVTNEISLPKFVEAFYTAPLFRCERAKLKYSVRRPSTDDEAADVAAGKIKSFAAWDVEDRSENQLLMCDMAAKTRSWFQAIPINGGTQLYFGSAVVADKNSAQLGWLFNVLLPLHKIYSRALLRGAVKQLSRDPFLTAAR